MRGTMICFDQYELEVENFQLRRSARSVRLERIPMELLLLLVRQAGHLVTREEILASIWGKGTFLDADNAINTAIRKIRRALHDDPDHPRYIETVTGKGYRFVADVTQVGGEPAKALSETHPPFRPPTDPIHGLGAGTRVASLLESDWVEPAPDLGLARPGPARPTIVTMPSHSAAVSAAAAGAGRPRPEGEHGQDARATVDGACLEHWEGTPTLPRFEVPALVDRSGAIAAPVAAARWARANVVVSISLVAVFAASLVWFLRPSPAPKVLRTVRLTLFGRAEDWERLVSDGSQLYFEVRNGGHYSIARVPTEGGEPTELATPFSNTCLFDISRDRAELLVGGGAPGSETPLWALPASGGSPRPLGHLVADDAVWSPDGHGIVYALGSDLYLAKADGSHSRKLATTAGAPHWPRWSPDGRVLRFTLEDRITHFLSLWEVSGEGRNLHRLLAGWREAPTAWGDGESGGEWTPDGKYFIFRSKRANLCSIWAIREKRPFLGRRSSVPMLLTTTDSYLFRMFPDGKRIFFVGSRYDRELERYDTRLQQFVPYLGGLPGGSGISFSRDRQWVAYTTLPDGHLWRSKVDGSHRLQLTFPPTVAGGPRWSPDGKQIAFSAATAGGSESRIYLVDSDGGNPEPWTPERYLATDPDWSPDGSSMLFSVRSPEVESDKWSIYRLDLRTHEISQLPGSEGLRAPAYSPDEKYVSAVVAADGSQLMLFDVRSERWTELARSKWFGVPPFWSRDGKYLYVQDLRPVDQPVLRIRIGDRKMEVVATRKQFTRADVKYYILTGVTPDGFPLVSLILSQDDIYALDVEYP
jgi:Tol biopolymer transport system component/DNA-binding winged helix-turn-helix (wHTH) protein